MDVNPYQSPQSVPEVEKRPVKPPDRFVLTVVYGFSCFVGVMLLQAIVVETVLAQTGMDRSLADMLRRLLVYGIIAAPVGTMIARWTWRAPEATWVFVVTMIGAILALTAVVFVTTLP